MNLRALFYPQFPQYRFDTEEEAIAATNPASTFGGISFYPLKCATKKDYAELFWRPRTLRLTTDLVYHTGDDWPWNGAREIEVRGFSYENRPSLTPDPADRAGADNEKQLVCPPYSSGVWVADTLITEPDPLHLDISEDVLFIAGLPRISLSLKLTERSENLLFFAGVQSYTNNAPDEAETEDVVCTVMGQDVQMYTWGPGSVGFVGTITIEVSEWWGFGDADGANPIWDSTTGEPIGENPLLLV